MTQTTRRWARLALAGVAAVAMAAGTVPGATAAPATRAEFAPAVESQKPTEAGRYIV